MDYELFMKYDDDDVAAADYDAADDEDDDAYVDDSLTFCRICTTALQKSFASTLWQSSHCWLVTVNSTINTCCNTAPFNTCKYTMVYLYLCFFRSKPSIQLDMCTCTVMH